MKKKFMNALALATAMVLTFGMTVYAAGSNDTDSTKGETIVADDVKADLTIITDKVESEQLYTEAETLQKGFGKIEASDPNVKGHYFGVVQPEAMKSAKSVANTMVAQAKGSNAKAAIVAAADIQMLNVPAEGVTLTITLNNFTANPNKGYMVMHLRDDGVWETIKEATVSGNKVVATFKSLSPIVLVEVTEDAGQAAPSPAPGNTNNNSNNNNSTVAATPAESPKTGETLPVAGIMAMICLAGALVSAKKVRYSK